MNLPTAVGSPILRTIQGTSYQFPRLNLREYGGLVQSWIDRDLSRLEKDLAARRANSREVADQVMQFKQRAQTDGYIYGKLADWREGVAIVDLSLKKGGYAIAADQLAMDLDDLTELCFELWSRQFLAGYRHYLRGRFAGEHDDPKEAPRAPRGEREEPGPGESDPALTGS